MGEPRAGRQPSAGRRVDDAGRSAGGSPLVQFASRTPGLLAAAAIALSALPAGAEQLAAAHPPPPQGIFAFLAAYPDRLARIERGILVWRDGTRTPLAKLGLDPQGRPLIRYQPADDPVVAATEAISAVDYEPLYLKMYGDCRTTDIRPRLSEVRWNRQASRVEVRAQSLVSFS